jgi:hypothetical protein
MATNDSDQPPARPEPVWTDVPLYGRPDLNPRFAGDPPHPPAVEVRPSGDGDYEAADSAADGGVMGTA